MSSKIKLMFDATILGNACDKTAGRSGIFFCALEILKRMKKNSDFEISFYAFPKTLYLLKKALNTELKEFKNIELYPTFTWIDYVFSFLKDKKHTYNMQKRMFLKFVFHFILFTAKIFFLIPNKLLHFIKNKKLDCNCFFSPCYACPAMLDLYPKIKKYTILYDVTPLLYQDLFKQDFIGECWQVKLINYMKKNPQDFYFSISQNTKNDFLKFLPDLNQNQIKVMPLACSEKFHPCLQKETLTSLKKYHLPTDKKYIFSLCSLAPHKNLIRAVKTFIQFIKKNKIDDLIFILGGGHYEDFIVKLDKEISDLGHYKDKIIKAGYIDDEDLAPLYSGAEWFVYTSQYEGFGLPPLEAMACGCPVITSNNSSLPEVVGQAGIMIDWDSDEQHIKAYENYYNFPKIREEMRRKGLARAKNFSWDKTADIIVKQIRKDLK